jgi:hypothetical protein
VAASDFRPKSDEEYEALIRACIQVRSRAHETLVRKAGEWLQGLGATVSNPYPLDLLISKPRNLIIEAKRVGTTAPIFAVREAVGQLHEYRHFVGPRDSELCILLDAAPDLSLLEYVEDELQLFVIWLEHERFATGPKTAIFLNFV